ncbi:MAG: glycosyltransferase [Fuerstiella sp.]|jgi:glycosyltransferase involved in cell wall biosynthesis|nr:glycosyltransferase [Fuerstiella sp.]
MSRIKVVFSIGSMHGGGAERQLVGLLRHIDRSRFEPFLYLVYGSGPLLAEIPEDIPIDTFESRDTNRPTRFPGTMHRRRVDDMSRFLRQVRADVSYDRTFLMTLIAADAAQRVNVPNISTIVTDPKYGFRPVAGRFQSVKRRRLRRLYTYSACVVANSSGAARSAESFYGLTPESVTTLYNGVDIDSVIRQATVKIDDDWWNATATARQSFRIATAGRLNREKGFHLLIDAVAQLRNLNPDVNLRLAILGEGQGRQDLETQISELQLQNRVRLLGFRTDAPAWYRTADLFVLPSFFEGMPNVLLESMACDTAVLSTDCPSGPAEILQNGQFGALCPIGNVNALTTEIAKFVADRSLAKRYTPAASEHVRQNFSISATVGHLENLLEDASNTHRA